MPIISRVEGNLVTLAQEGNYQAIVQGCNCFCTMGSGLAPQIAKAWPMAEAVDKATERGDVTKLGDYTAYYDSHSNVTILNAYTQYSYGGKGHNVSYDAVYRVFSKLNTTLLRGFIGDPRPVGIPLIGAGLAGGHWEAIELLINLATPDLSIELVLYND